MYSVHIHILYKHTDLKERIFWEIKFICVHIVLKENKITCRASMIQFYEYITIQNHLSFAYILHPLMGVLLSLYSFEQP